MKPVFTVVDDGYDVSVYFTLHDLCKAVADDSLFIVPVDESEPVPATGAEIRKAFRTRNVVELSEDGDRDWKFKMVRHN